MVYHIIDYIYWVSFYQAQALEKRYFLLTSRRRVILIGILKYNINFLIYFLVFCIFYKLLKSELLSSDIYYAKKTL